MIGICFWGCRGRTAPGRRRSAPNPEAIRYGPRGWHQDGPELAAPHLRLSRGVAPGTRWSNTMDSLLVRGQTKASTPCNGVKVSRQRDGRRRGRPRVGCRRLRTGALAKTCRSARCRSVSRCALGCRGRPRSPSGRTAPLLLRGSRILRSPSSSKAGATRIAAYGQQAQRPFPAECP